jgi:hypothetical protein
MQYEILACQHHKSLIEHEGAGADEGLEKRVAEYIRNGWQPQGGVSSILQGDELWCFQAMVKE